MKYHCQLRMILLFVGAIFVIAFSTQLHAFESSDTEFFQHKIEPILKSKCLGCHSHESRTMEGGLTLDSRSGWQSGGDRGPAILPGDPAGSLLIKAIQWDDPDLQMPPDERLSQDEVDLFIAWVQKGAVDPREAMVPEEPLTNWWSLKKLTRPEVPGQGHPIDAFINKQLQEQGFKPTERADRVTLIRRLYTNLLGYLPSPEEVAAFVNNEDPRAYSKLIDQLLSSPAYGERWARHWLDVIHFADSHGCEHDVKRNHAWRYRDYVINRLNDDVPWSRFIKEQLAPDFFYPQEPELRAGLGFIAAGPLELSRAGTAPVTFDYLDRDDIVTQTMASFVSTTANCARCHTHKFDPISQEDYYSLQAVFAGVGKGDIEFDASYQLMQRRQELKQLLAATQSGDQEILLKPQYAEFVDRWITVRRSLTVEWKPLVADVFVSSGGATLTKLDNGSVLASGTVPDQEQYTVTSPVELQRLTAVRLDVLNDESLPHNGPGRAGNGNLHLTEAMLHWLPSGASTSTPLKIKRASASFDQDGWTSEQAIDGDLQSGWAIYPRVNESHHIVFELESPVEVSTGGKLAVTLKQLYPPKHVIGRFRLSVTDASGGAAQVFSAAVRSGLTKTREQRTQAEAVAIAAIALKEHAQRELSKLPAQEIVYGVSSSWSHAKKLPAPQSPKTVHLLRRGAFDQPVKEVGPGTLSAIAWLPGRFDEIDSSQEAQRRAALADWIAHPENPLTWRSIVNRVWHYHFGRGLCDTPNDFGRMGSSPSHPELLDWLAIWFRDEAKGSLKELHRLVLTSEAWQRSSTGASNPQDSENRLLWRMNRKRLDAEVFRDSVLRISRRLDAQMGGPGIEQFQKTKGQQATPALDYSTFDWNSQAAHRRSIYRVVWRGIPDPFMEALDFPDLGLLTPKRGFSVSALQSLAMYNNDFVLHGSQRLADSIVQEHPELTAQVDRAVQLTWSRLPSHVERARLVAYTRKHGLSACCRVLLNSNEFLFVD